MSDIDLEALRRQARQLERNEGKGGGGFAPSFDFILDELEDYGWLVLATVVGIGLSIYLGSFAPIIYLAVVIGAGMVLALAWMVVEPVFEFVMDHLEEIKEGVAVLPGLLLEIGVLVSSLSQGKGTVDAFVLAFISFALISGLTRLAFWLLEWAVEHWGWGLLILFTLGVFLK